jgi:hypothetical protein
MQGSIFALSDAREEDCPLSRLTITHHAIAFAHIHNKTAIGKCFQFALERILTGQGQGLRANGIVAAKFLAVAFGNQLSAWEEINFKVVVLNRTMTIPSAENFLRKDFKPQLVAVAAANG